MDSVSGGEAREPQRIALVRTVMAGLPRLDVGTAGAGFAAILLRDAVAAGLNPADVREWITAAGGWVGDAYMRARPTTMARNECRTPLQPLPYFAVPIAAFEPQQLDAA